MQSSALYRPQTWGEVIGQSAVVASLQKLLETRVPVAIGFSGEPGSGKTTLAHLVAKAVQPDVPEDQIDIQHINCADKNGVDDARVLAEEARFRPMSGRYRVHILDEAHMLTVQAQNALLIPTEAKESHTVWIICTTDPQKLIPALKSRCVWYQLKPFGVTEIEVLYATLAARASVEFPSELFAESVRKALTSPRDLCYCFDKVQSGMSPQEAVSASREQDVQYAEICSAILRGWSSAVPLLQNLKASDAKPLRVVLAYTLRSRLLGREGTNAAAIAELLIRLSQQESFEDSVSLAATTAALYIFCSKYHRTAALYAQGQNEALSFKYR